MNYEFAYKIGFHPWEDAEHQSRFVETFDQLVAREESGRESPYGAALDLGTGSGIWGVRLAQRGWEVTGVDVVDKALERARRRSEEAGVQMRLLKGDVSDLRASEVGSEFRLLLDTGTFHGLGSAEREAMAREVGAVAAPDATLLLLVWSPRRRGPLPHGASREEIENLFAGWTVTDVLPSGLEPPKPVEALFRPDEHWYRLHRA
jgi:SAM-dependent methyltransferase